MSDEKDPLELFQDLASAPRPPKWRDFCERMRQDYIHRHSPEGQADAAARYFGLPEEEQRARDAFYEKLSRNFWKDPE